MRQFEFHAYKGDEHGRIAERAEMTIKEFAETISAKGYAGRMAKRVNGPVDLARADGEFPAVSAPWESRYITTASPSDYHKSGYRFERLDR